MEAYAIESFIMHCDDMMIVEESAGGSIIKKVVTGFKNAIQKIITWFKNALLSINYFKNAKLDPQMNKDLVKVLDVCRPQTELNFKLIQNLFKLQSMTNTHGKSVGGGGRFGVAPDRQLFGISLGDDTSLADEIYKSYTDIESSIEAAKKLPEYKRLEEDSYKNENLQQIPLGVITGDMKKCNSNATNFGNQVTKLETVSLERVPSNAKSAISKMMTFCRKVVEYYTFRIHLLSKYLKKAKLSLTGTVRNIKEKIGNTDNRGKFGTISRKKVTVKIEEAKEIQKLYDDCKSAKVYQDYKPIYDKLTQKLNINKAVIENILIDGTTIYVDTVSVKETQISVGGRKLYHTSNENGLTEIEPRFKTMSNILFPEPRAYFHLNIPLNRYSHIVKSGEHVYEVVGNVSTVYQDPELGRTAVYAKTTAPIRVKEIDYKEFEKLHKVNLDMPS